MQSVKFDKMEILVDCGRILKLEPVPGLNVFWNNPSDEKTSYGWYNPGGDRVWISPESELFMPDGTSDSYTVPEGADPGKWTVSHQCSEFIEMVNDVSVKFFPYDRTLDLKMTRTITPLVSDAPQGVAFAGYEQKLNLISLDDLPAELRPALWSVLQLPPGGKIMFPAGKMVLFTGNMPVNAGNSDIMTLAVPSSDGIPCKIGLPAGESRGVMAYMNLESRIPYLVIRRFKTVPDGRYADAPLKAPQSPCAQQFYLDDGKLGGFGEMEYHSQYLTAQEPSICDTSELRAYAGSPEQLKEILADAFTN